jgi:hypothetical protein
MRDDHRTKSNYLNKLSFLHIYERHILTMMRGVRGDSHQLSITIRRRQHTTTRREKCEE